MDAGGLTKHQLECVQPVISANGVTKVYHTQGPPLRALDSVTLEVSSGDFIAVMGPSGSGKSTLLQMLGGLEMPSAGEVFFDGRKLADLPDAELSAVRRRRVGFVFQFFGLVSVLSIEENVVLPGLFDGRRLRELRLRATEVLETVGLAARRSDLPSKLSGGEQQRVAIARALLLEPAVILADEPTGNLDWVSGRTVLSLLKASQVELGRSVVLATHDPKAAAFADRVLFLRDGRLAGNLNLGGEVTTAARGAEVESRAELVLAWLKELEV